MPHDGELTFWRLRTSMSLSCFLKADNSSSCDGNKKQEEERKNTKTETKTKEENKTAQVNKKEGMMRWRGPVNLATH